MFWRLPSNAGGREFRRALVIRNAFKQGRQDTSYVPNQRTIELKINRHAKCYTRNQIDERICPWQENQATCSAMASVNQRAAERRLFPITRVSKSSTRSSAPAFFGRCWACKSVSMCMYQVRVCMHAQKFLYTVQVAKVVVCALHELFSSDLCHG